MHIATDTQPDKGKKPRTYWFEQDYWLSREVQEFTRLSSTTIWRLERKGAFPRRIRIGGRVVWDARAVQSYMREAAARASSVEAA
jgi:predicted DNA-binding transcriptional regulator AlpA